MIELFADLHEILIRRYLRQVDKHDILICEVSEIAASTAAVFADPDNIDTPRATRLIGNLSTDEVNNVTAQFVLNGNEHTHTLTSKVGII